MARFDSDYMFLNLVNVKESVDAWLNIGSSCEIRAPRRSNIAAWKNKVKNIDAFKAAAKQKYVCAEDFLLTVQDELGLPFKQGVAYEGAEGCLELGFSALQNGDIPPTKLTMLQYGLTPCEPGKISACFVNNHGAASRGIAVIFTGAYVEDDNITIDDAEFAYRSRQDEPISVPITFEKVRLADGQWALLSGRSEFQNTAKSFTRSASKSTGG